MEDYDLDTAIVLIEKKIKEGRGQGTGRNYRAWIDVARVPGWGRDNFPLGLTTGRDHQFHTDREYHYFRLLDLDPCVTDIREYYALTEIDETVSIAKLLGLKHPTKSNSNEPEVLLITYLINRRDGDAERLEAHLFRSKNALEQRKTLEEIEIIYQFLYRRQIPLYIATQAQLSKDLIWNLELLTKHYSLQDQQLLDSEIQTIADILTEEVQRCRLPLRHICNECTERLGHKPGTALSVAYHLIARRQWQVDLTKRIDTDAPLKLRSFNGGHP
jgi:hypothetical protein